eukprot:ctg_2402.g755
MRAPSASHWIADADACVDFLAFSGSRVRACYPPLGEMSQSVEVRQLFLSAYAQGVRVGMAFCEVDWGVVRHVEAREAAPYDTVRRVVDALAPAGVVCSETASAELRTALQGEPVYFEDTSGGRLAPELENVPAERLSAAGAEA